jgi:hypothetical protein
MTVTLFGGEAPSVAYPLGANGFATRMSGPLAPMAAPAMPPEALRQQAAALLQRCYRWLEAAVPVVPQVAGFVPALATAVAQYEAQQYDACLAQAIAVITAARQVQMSVPTLPPL